MDYLVLEGIKPWDGRYEFDLEGAPLTINEWGWIKRHAGYLPLTVDDGLAGADPELFTVFAAIALRRAGRLRGADIAEFVDGLGDSPFEATIRLETGAEDSADDEGEAAPLGSSNASTPIFGADSKTTLDPSAEQPPAIGTPASAISGLASGT